MAVRTSARPMSTPLQRASTNIKRGAGARGAVTRGRGRGYFQYVPWSWSWSWSLWSWSWYVCRRLAVSSEGCGNGGEHDGDGGPFMMAAERYLQSCRKEARASANVPGATATMATGSKLGFGQFVHPRPFQPSRHPRRAAGLWRRRPARRLPGARGPARAWLRALWR